MCIYILKHLHITYTPVSKLPSASLGLPFHYKFVLYIFYAWLLLAVVGTRFSFSSLHFILRLALWLSEKKEFQTRVEHMVHICVIIT